MSPGLRNRLAFVALAVVFVLATGACGGEAEPDAPEADPTTTTTEALSAEAVLKGAAEEIATLSTTKFTMVDENETGAKFMGTTLKRLNAEVEEPDRFKLAVEAQSALGFVRIQVVGIGDEVLMQLFDGAPWSPVEPDQIPFNLTGLGMTLHDILLAIEDATISGSESLGGGPALRLETTLASDDLSALITNADSGHSLDALLWIGESDRALRQIRIAGQVYDDDAQETVRVITIEDVDVPVDITLPGA